MMKVKVMSVLLEFSVVKYFSMGRESSNKSTTIFGWQQTCSI